MCQSGPCNHQGPSRVTLANQGRLSISEAITHAATLAASAEKWQGYALHSIMRGRLVQAVADYGVAERHRAEFLKVSAEYNLF